MSETILEKKINNMKKPSRMATIFNTVLMCVLIFATIITVGFNIVFSFHPVEGTSMKPLLNKNDIDEDGVYINNFSTGDYGDIVIAISPNRNINGTEKWVVKRLIAKGGDKLKIEYTNNIYKMFIIKHGNTNQEQINYTAINGGITEVFYDNFYSHSMSKSFDGQWLIIPQNYVFYIGDNMTSANSSVDCADYGPVSEDNIIGKVAFVIYKRSQYIKQIIHQIFNPVI